VKENPHFAESSPNARLNGAERATNPFGYLGMGEAVEKHEFHESAPVGAQMGENRTYHQFAIEPGETVIGTGRPLR